MSPDDLSPLSEIVQKYAIAAVGVAGVIALLLIIYGGLMFTLSKGDQTKVEEAKEVITNALAGLALIVFASVILRIIGYDIFGIHFFNSQM